MLKYNMFKYKTLEFIIPVINKKQILYTFHIKLS